VSQATRLLTGERMKNVELSRQQHLDLYYHMRLNRAVEDTMVKLFRQNKIVGGLYSSLGQEAVSVGTASALQKKDWLAPMIRNIGALLVKGVPPRDIFTQHMAKYTSPTLGKDGTSHFGDLEDLHIVSPISMLGDLIPVMTGVAMAGRYLGQKIVAMTWIGDGGSSTGVFHEGLNLAATQKAPFVLVLENNGWAYSTPVRRQVPIENLADRAKAYGIDSYIVDGNDVADVYTTAKEAVERARNGEGPILIEAKTFRRMGHAQHDPAEYVPKDMRAYWEARDPILLHEKFLTEKGYLDDETKKEIATKLDELLSKDRDFAESSPMPPPELAEKGVYCTGDDCHKIAAKWERDKSEVIPPKSSIDASWMVEGFGRGKGSGGGTAPIHFGDTAQSEERKEEENISNVLIPGMMGPFVEEKLSPETPAEVVTEEVIKPSAAKAVAAKSKNGAGKKNASKDAGATKAKPIAKVAAKVAAKPVAKVVAKSASKPPVKPVPKSAKKPVAKIAAKKGRR
jgi:TPP-dependent pyruvate/acetoin dehydrogenase alpha subunit